MGYITSSSPFSGMSSDASIVGVEGSADTVRIFGLREAAQTSYQTFHTVFIPSCKRSLLPGPLRPARLPVPGPFRGAPEPRDTAGVRAGNSLSRACHENRARAMLYAAVASARKEVCFSLAAQVTRGKNQLLPSPFLEEVLGENAPRQWKSTAESGDLQAHGRSDTMEECELSSDTDLGIAAADVARSPHLMVNGGKSYDGAATRGPLYLSFSSINTYDQCPYSYYLQHILHVTPPPNPRMVYGRAMHEAVAWCLRGTEGDSMNPPPTLQGALEEFNRHFEGCAFETASQAKMLAANGAAGMKAFLLRLLQGREKRVPTVGNGETERVQGDCPVGGDGVYPRVLVERKFRVRIPEVDVILSGVFDRVDVVPGVDDDSPARRLSITDYKSNVGTKDPGRMVRDSLQLRLYSLAGKLLFGVNPAAVMIESIEDGRIGVAVPAPADAELALEAISACAAGVRAKNFDATPSFQACTFCGFKNMCHHSVVTNSTL